MTSVGQVTDLPSATNPPRTDQEDCPTRFTRDLISQRLLQQERQPRFSRDLHFLAFSEDLAAGPQSATRQRTDCRSRAAADQPAEDRSDCYTAAGPDRRTFRP